MTQNYTREFKLKVALELIKGDLTSAQIQSKYKISKSTANGWRRQLLDQGHEIFGKPKESSKKQEEDLDRLHATIGRLKVENDFLERSLKGLK